MAKQSESSGRKWTKEQRKHFIATMTAKRNVKVSRGVEVTNLVLAKKLRRMIIKEITTKGDIGDVELTALLLLKGLLGHRDR